MTDNLQFYQRKKRNVALTFGSLVLHRKQGHKELFVKCQSIFSLKEKNKLPPNQPKKHPTVSLHILHYFRLPKSWEKYLGYNFATSLLDSSWGSKTVNNRQKYFGIPYLSPFKAISDTIS